MTITNTLLATEYGVTVNVFTSDLDGTTVVQIDTDDSGRVRVNINDGDPIWDADPETHHHSFCECTRRLLTT